MSKLLVYNGKIATYNGKLVIMNGRQQLDTPEILMAPCMAFVGVSNPVNEEEIKNIILEISYYCYSDETGQAELYGTFYVSSPLYSYVEEGGNFAKIVPLAAAIQYLSNEWSNAEMIITSSEGDRNNYNPRDVYIGSLNDVENEVSDIEQLRNILEKINDRIQDGAFSFYDGYDFIKIRAKFTSVGTYLDSDWSPEYDVYEDDPNGNWLSDRNMLNVNATMYLPSAQVLEDDPLDYTSFANNEAYVGILIQTGTLYTENSRYIIIKQQIPTKEELIDWQEQHGYANVVPSLTATFVFTPNIRYWVYNQSLLDPELEISIRNIRLYNTTSGQYSHDEQIFVNSLQPCGEGVLSNSAQLGDPIVIYEYLPANFNFSFVLDPDYSE